MTTRPTTTKERLLAIKEMHRISGEGGHVISAASEFAHSVEAMRRQLSMDLDPYDGENADLLAEFVKNRREGIADAWQILNDLYAEYTRAMEALDGDE